jgi:hypothetical protein
MSRFLVVVLWCLFLTGCSGMAEMDVSIDDPEAQPGAEGCVGDITDCEEENVLGTTE